MANGYGTSEPLSGKTGARIDALMELTHELPALEDRKALARVLNRQRAADVAGILIYLGLATLLLQTLL